MRPSFLLRISALGTLLLAAGCSSSNKGRIEGTKWTSPAANAEDKTTPAAPTRLEFDSDGKLTLKQGSETYQGAYSLGMGPTVTFTFEKDYRGRKIHAEKIAINGDRLTLTDSDGTSLAFQRAK